MTVHQPSVEIYSLSDVETVEQLRPVLESTVVDPQTKQPIEAEVDRQLDEIRASMDDVDTPHFVAWANGKPVGVMGMRPYTPTDTYPDGWGKPAELVHAHVSKDTQRKGIGSALLARIDSIAANRGYDELTAPNGPWLRWGKEGFFRKTFDRMTFDDFDEDAKLIWRKKLNEIEPIHPEQIIDLVHKAIPEFNTDEPVYGETNDDILAPNFEALLKDPQATIITIEDERGRHVAFTLTIPIDRMDMKRLNESAETAYIYITCVDPALQHQGLAGSLMRGLHSALRNKGFRYIERDIILNTGTGFAGKITKNYGDAIVESRQHEKWPELGKQRFFRIDLTKLPKN